MIFNEIPLIFIEIHEFQWNLFHQNLFFNRAGQINQWPEQKSMEYFSTKIFFYSGRPNQLINAELFRQGRYCGEEGGEDGDDCVDTKACLAR